MSSGDSGNRFEVVTPEDHSADLWIVTMISVIVTTLAIIGRFGSKAFFHYKTSADDYVMVAAFVSTSQIAYLTLEIDANVDFRCSSLYNAH